MNKKQLAVPLICVNETNSTNSYLQTLCADEKVEELTTVVADFQSSGRGQRGNSWESASGANLLFSLVLYPQFLEAREQFLISRIVALAVKETLDEYVDDISIKWPNDIYRGNRKISGMLIENDLTGRHISRSIAGVGLNVNQEIFRSDAPNPVSLRQITGRTFDRMEILGGILQRIKSYYEMSRMGDTETIVDRYAQALFRREGMHRYRDAVGEFMARMVEVKPDGQLVLEDDNHCKRYYLFKEVEYVL